MDIVFMGKDVEIDIESYTPYKPAKLFGLPENCEPEEGAEVEWDFADGTDEFLIDIVDRFDLYGEIEEIILDEINK